MINDKMSNEEKVDFLQVENEMLKQALKEADKINALNCLALNNLHLSNKEIRKYTYSACDNRKHPNEQFKQGYFSGYLRGCYWMRGRYKKTLSFKLKTSKAAK